MAQEKLGIDPKEIMAIMMPGFGTTNRTYQNAINLIQEYRATLKEIDIKKNVYLSLKRHLINYPRQRHHLRKYASPKKYISQSYTPPFAVVTKSK